MDQLQHPQFNKIFYVDESPIYQFNDFKDDYANPNPNRRSEFLNPDRGDGFLIQSATKEDTQILTNLGSLLLMGILMLSQPYFATIKLMSGLALSIFQMRSSRFCDLQA